MSRINQFLVLLLMSMISNPSAAYDQITGEESCQPGWKMNVDNERCYYISKESVRYWKARERCENMGAHLTTDSSKSEQNFLKSELFQSKEVCAPQFQRCNDFWIGLHFTHKYWTWPDNSVATESHWFPDFPTPSNKCGLMSIDTVTVGWKNENCQVSMRYICKAYCPNGFVYNKDANTCYKIIPDAFSWQESYKRCNSLNPASTLAIISKPDDIKATIQYINDEVQKDSTLCFDHVYKANFWIGARRPNSQDCNDWYRWTTNNESVLMEFTNWSDGEPNCKIDGEMCVFSSSFFDNKWMEGYCDVQRCPLCELKIGSLA